MRYLVTALMILLFQVSAHANLENAIPTTRSATVETSLDAYFAKQIEAGNPVSVADVRGHGYGYGGHGDLYNCSVFTECPNGRALTCKAHTSIEGNRACNTVHNYSVSCADENSTVYATCDQY